MVATKLPALWRRNAYAVAAVDYDDPSNRRELDQLVRSIPGLHIAVERNWEIVLQVASSTKNHDFGRVEVRFAVEMFANGSHLRTYACHSFEEAIRTAELYARYLPNCVVLAGSKDEARRDLDFTSASALLANDPPELAWHVRGLLPASEVTLLSGDGGTGKSLAALQLATSTAAGRPWFGHELMQGPAVFLSAEDGRDEIHRRLRAICDADGIGQAELVDLGIRSMVGEDALLAILNPDTRMIEPTAAYDALERMVRDVQPTLLVLDTLADLFGGDENVRGQARQFIGLLKRLTIPCGTTILCFAHPSVAGINSGTGSSGSTGWSNSVRSRLYLERITEWRGKGDNRRLVEIDPNARLLTTKKANYAQAGGTLRIRWRGGSFERHDLPAITETSTLLPSHAAEDAASRIEAKFMDLLSIFGAEGRNVGPLPSSSYAPTLFAKDGRSEKISKAAFAKAMGSLIAEGRVKVEETKRGTKRLVVVETDPTDPPTDGVAD